MFDKKGIRVLFSDLIFEEKDSAFNEGCVEFLSGVRKNAVEAETAVQWFQKVHGKYEENYSDEEYEEYMKLTEAQYKAQTLCDDTEDALDYLRMARQAMERLMEAEA